MNDGPLLEITFDAEVIHWRGPAPFFFVAVPAGHAVAVGQAARTASYGWGVVPVNAEISDVTFTTSLFPRDGTYLVPLKNAVREKAEIALGDTVNITITVEAR